MLAKPVAEIPPGQLYEPKWDGFRSIIFRDGPEVEIGSRNERPMTRYFPEIVDAVLANFPERAVIDGEIIVADTERNTLDFEALQQRIHPAASRVNLLAVQTPASFVAFDLLALGDEDLTEAPLVDRRARLEEVLADAAPPVHVTPVTRDLDTARVWFDRFEGAGLDGLIAKKLDLRYQPDKRVMSKIEHERTADCVVAGYRVHKSGPEALGSLLLGLYDERGVLAVGRRRRRLPDGDAAEAPHRAAAARHDVRGAPVELGRPRAGRADEGRAQEERRAGWNAAHLAQDETARGDAARTFVVHRCARSGSSRSATTTWRASGSRRTLRRRSRPEASRKSSSGSRPRLDSWPGDVGWPAS